MKRFLLLAATLFAGTALAAATYTPSGWQLVNSAGTTDQASYAACVTALKAQPLPARSRTDYCREKWLTRVTADPLPPPPLPVDCVVSAWVDVVGDWSACSNGTQTRTTSRARSVVTPAANGGAACPALVGSAVESRSCTVDPPPVVDPPPTGQVITVSAGQSISSAVAQLQPGGTVVVKPGTYAPFTPKACKPDAYCTVKAETDGTVNVTGLNIGAGNWYTRLEGLKFTGSDTKSVTGNFVKLVRIGFLGGPASGNAASVQIGTNDYTPGASNILLEDVWVGGSGGRYKLIVYNATNVVLRRVVVRHDGGWTPSKGDPQGGIALYDSAHVRAENVMCLDSAQGLAGFEACIYLVSNGTTSTHAADVVVNGAIVVDSPNNGIAAEGSAAATWSVIDSAVLRSAAGGFNTNGSGKLSVTRGFADVKGAPFAAWNGSLSASGCIFKGGSNSGASLSNCSSTLPGEITAPNALGQGPNIAFRIGIDGSLFGEPGFEDVTAAPLWPWPNEERIKADFDAVRPAFGGRSITGYVQGATP